MRHLRANALLVAALAALAVVAAAGCSSSSGSSSSDGGGGSTDGPPGGLGASCTINTDCADPLVCIFGACHQQCAASRDCPAGEMCVVTPPGNVCELPSESTCGATGPTCQGSLVCAADDRCRTPCTGVSSCLANQICQGGACYDPGELD